eukprot:TRINITY_DN14009_c0_g1_i1.p1 TRINITY_DN14009_c0_g1~~TRINITY_DN14009_c0_g1_i1.p1  ORF type:complete len:294 (-),score=45.71 TRINITY_DN14009_c0_g1_i1:61-942(-)
MQNNLSSRCRDPYLHTNCLAILSNLAPHCVQLHANAADRLLSLVRVLARKYYKIISELHLNQTLTQQKTEELLEELNTFTELIRVVLEIMYVCVRPPAHSNSTPSPMKTRSGVHEHHNVHLIYCLLQRREILEPLKNARTILNSSQRLSFASDRLWDFVSVLSSAINYFDAALQAAKLHDFSVESVTKVLSAANRGWLQKIGLKASGLAVNEMKFTYEEQTHPEEFFLPYIWSAVALSSHLHFDLQRVILFKPTQNQAGYYSEPPNTEDHSAPPSPAPSADLPAESKFDAPHQ